MFLSLCFACVHAFFPPMAEKRNVDLLITDAWIVTVDANAKVYERGAIAVDNGTILAVGPTSELQNTYTAKQHITAPNKVVMPGLINTHTHSAMTLLRGISDDVDLKTWLEDFIWPAEKAVMTPEAVRAGTALALVEMIRSGTTMFNDGYFYAEQVAQVTADAGMRALVAEPVADFAMPGSKDEAGYYRLVEEMLAKWKGHPLIRIAIGPHAPYTCSGPLLKRLGEFATKHDIPVHIHLSETQQELKIIQEKYGTTPVRHLANLGLVNERLIAAHGVVVDAQEIQLLLAGGAGVAHNPQSNMKLGSGIAPVAEMIATGLTVGLGTDSAASNNNLDLLEEMGTAALLQKLKHGDPSIIRADQIVYMATMGGARTLGMDKWIGSLEPGKRADLIVIDLDAPHLTPVYDLNSLLTYVVTGADVESVMVDGRWLMQNRKLLTLDETAIIKQARVLGKQIQETIKK